MNDQASSEGEDSESNTIPRKREVMGSRRLLTVCSEVIKGFTMSRQQKKNRGPG